MRKTMWIGGILALSLGLPGLAAAQQSPAPRPDRARAAARWRAVGRARPAIRHIRRGARSLRVQRRELRRDRGDIRRDLRLRSRVVRPRVRRALNRHVLRDRRDLRLDRRALRLRHRDFRRDAPRMRRHLPAPGHPFI